MGMKTGKFIRFDEVMNIIIKSLLKDLGVEWQGPNYGSLSFGNWGWWATVSLPYLKEARWTIRAYLGAFRTLGAVWAHSIGDTPDWLRRLFSSGPGLGRTTET